MQICSTWIVSNRDFDLPNKLFPGIGASVRCGDWLHKESDCCPKSSLGIHESNTPRPVLRGFKEHSS
jgi:hypothetical protein